ncbi:MAG TPA: ribonuclease PH [Candidatus Omnitrophota bacterium]|nr:ribonuclease PH [Candidatus Omnitrophota bacterium]
MIFNREKAEKKMRKIKLTKGFLKYALGSCLIECGNTKVICAVSMEETVPSFLKGKGKGWITAEYGMLPASTQQRNAREASKGRLTGRTQEIQRLIGRSLRAVVDLEKLGERTFWIDADVLQADGGTRTASVTGGFVALAQACERLIAKGILAGNPIRDYVAATSVGLVDGKLCLDLCYKEDSRAEVDMNVIMTGSGRFVEVQGTAEGRAFNDRELASMLALAKKGIRKLIGEQKKAVKLPLK